MLLPFSLFAQKEEVDKFNGLWIDTISEYQFIIQIDKGKLSIKDIENREQQHVLKYKNEITWFETSKTEKFVLNLSKNGALLWINYSSSEDESPIAVPYITTLIFTKKMP
jgi:hypothetical protein